jgi:hypothetical protein
VIELPTLNEARHVFAQLAYRYGRNHGASDRATAERSVCELVGPVLLAAQELVAWLALNEPWGPCEVTISWGETAFVEARDHGRALPRPDVSQADAALAARLLAISAAEWRAEADDRGRRLSAALRVARHSGEADRS